MEATKRLSNLQLELLRMFHAELSEEQLKEMRNLLANYFAHKARSDMNALFEEKGHFDFALNVDACLPA
jgi:hypothetical protein